MYGGLLSVAFFLSVLLPVITRKYFTRTFFLQFFPFTISLLAPCSFQFVALFSFFAFTCSFFIFLCSLLLLQFPHLLPAPFSFLPFAPFSLIPCSFFIFLCSLFLFHFSSCSMLLFQIFHCSMLLFTIFAAPCSRITLVCSLLLYLFYGLLLAPLRQIGLAPCSGITPNGGSPIHSISLLQEVKNSTSSATMGLRSPVFTSCLLWIRCGLWCLHHRVWPCQPQRLPQRPSPRNPCGWPLYSIT